MSAAGMARLLSYLTDCIKRKEKEVKVIKLTKQKTFSPDGA
jgi:hypothetical protein